MEPRLNSYTSKINFAMRCCSRVLAFSILMVAPLLALSGEVDIDLANSYLSKGNYIKANRIYFRALNEGVYREESLYGLAQGYVSVNKINDAIQRIDELLSLNPSHLKGLLLKSKVLLVQVGDANSALPYLQLLKQLDSSNPEVWLLLENTYAQLGNEHDSNAARAEYTRLRNTGK